MWGKQGETFLSSLASFFFSYQFFACALLSEHLEQATVKVTLLVDFTI